MAGRIVGTPLGNGKVLPKKSGKSVYNLNDLDREGLPANFVMIELGRDADADMDGKNGTGPTAMIVNMEPGYEFPSHYHKFDQIAIVIEGSFIVGRTEYGPGTIRLQDADSVYGPVKAGPNGCKIVGFFSGGPDIRDYHVNEKDAKRAQEQSQKYFGGKLQNIDWKF
jgi:hypothetical protein